MSVSYITARKSDDTACIRNRVGTLPDGYDRRHKRHFGYQAGLLLLVAVVSFLVGMVAA